MSAGLAQDAAVAAVARLAPSLAETFRDPWWLIGSTAMLLAGVDDIVPHDIDVLASARDAEAFVLRHAGLIERDHRPPGDELFRSRFARFRFAPLPVEVMGGLQVCRDGAWKPVRIGTTRMVDCGGGAVVPVPSPAEQLRLFEWFGRDKDIDKARRLRARAVIGDRDVA
jgi:hypothetical protein